MLQRRPFLPCPPWLAVPPAYIVLAAFAVAAGLPQRAHAQAVDPPALASLLTDAMASQRTIAIKRLGQAKAADTMQAARRHYLPTIDLDARYTHMFTGGLNFGDLINPAYAALNQLLGAEAFPTDLSYQLPIPFEAKLRVTQPLYVPQIGTGLALARQGERAAALERAITEREVAFAMRSAYWGYVRAALLAELLRETRPLLEEHQRVSELLVKTGKLTEDASMRAAAELLAHDQQLADVLAKQRIGSRALNQLAGRHPDQAIAVPTAMMRTGDVDGAAAATATAPPSAPDVDASIAAGAGQRQELALAQVAKQVAQLGVRRAKQAARPTVAATLDYGVQSQDLTFDKDSDYLAASIVASWQVFAGGRTRSSARQAQRDVAIAGLQAAEAREQIELEVRQAREAYDVAKLALGSARARITSTQAALAIVERRYAAGAVPQLELIAARSEFLRAQTDEIVALTDLYQSLAALARATGDSQP